MQLWKVTERINNKVVATRTISASTIEEAHIKEGHSLNLTEQTIMRKTCEGLDVPLSNTFIKKVNVTIEHTQE